jgi:chromosomal replication initiation ATPase DnaA
MKNDIFNQYVDKVTELFGVSREELFSKTKRRDIVDARYMLYYLCFKRPMTLRYIQKFMTENGYDIQHPSVIYGINVAVERAKNDSDYAQIIKDTEKSVFI